MAVIKCKMCGGDLVLTEGSTIAICEYCGSRQTVPAADNEKKLTLFERANRHRFDCEFDKAAGIYESVVADFPEEAEAYWGLVLCKYGIEYVDDPKTGKKIPTCHRSSYDSIMDDPDLDKVLENAESAARKVYQEEARQIEKLRKDILEVSGKEDPYDIFICYKETDKDGNRTVDSVLAQDLYTALTDKGYRVFFSRITLEDKLGQAYEPYIFAALNSAKVMLAVGTDYEHYNAVWVRNEWTRFLKLTDGTQKKVLIPCYKDIDAYDMPKEFRHLQAQDLGKVGAIQDLLRGIGKLIPREEHVVQQTVVVQQTIQNGHLDILLKRGNMALEDREWKKADEFFEEALNQNTESAEAHLGKFLIKQEVPDLDSWVIKYLKLTETAKEEKHDDLEADEEHVSEIVNRYAIDGYLDEQKIREMYQRLDFSYSSKLNDRMHQRAMLDQFWNRNNELVRAERFAVGETLDRLKQTRKKLEAELERRIDQANQEKLEAKRQRREVYKKFLKMTDERVNRLYEEAQSQRENEFQQLCQAQQEQDPNKLLQYAERFDRLQGYKNSQELAQWCREKSKQLVQNKMRAMVEEKRRIQEEREEFQALYEECREKNIRLSKIFIILEAILFIVGTIGFTIFLINSNTDGESVPFVLGLFGSALILLIFMCPVLILTTLAARFTEKTDGQKKPLVGLSRFLAIIGMLFFGLGSLTEPELWSCAIFAMHFTAFVILFFRKSCKLGGTNGSHQM